MKISVFGLGYVGAVSCGCLAALGHEVVGVDVAKSKIDQINAGESPIIEPGLHELITDAVAERRLRATDDARAAIKATDVALLCVGTPSSTSGGLDTRYLKNVCRDIGQTLRERRRRFTVIVRSTSHPAVHQLLSGILEAQSDHALGGPILGYVCHPEFLREGVAVKDFYAPPKIVFGTDDELSRVVCGELYPGIEAPTFYVAPAIAAMVKYADNAFHAVKVTFGNEIGLLCRTFGVDARAVMDVFCSDTKLNISPKYLRPGMPFGGSCLPKDVRALLDLGREAAVDTPLLHGTIASNGYQVSRILDQIRTQPRASVGIVGLAFKEGTDDVRESPMVHIVEQLVGKGHPVRIYDENLSVASLVGRNRSYALESIPHLAELLEPRLDALTSTVDVLIVHQKLRPTAWESVRWRGQEQRILDVVGLDALRAVPGYEGLYW